MSSQKNEIANQQKTLRNKVAERSGAGSGKLGLDHFEKYEVVSKTSFALLGGMAGELLNRNGRKQLGILHGLENKEYCDVAKELFEELCATIDLPPSVIGQCVNACDKLIIDSRPKKIKTKKIDAAMMDKLDEDNMGEEEDEAANRKKAGAPGSKRGPKGPLVDSDDDGEDGGAGGGKGEDVAVDELTEEQLEKMKKEEDAKRAAEESEATAQRKAREAADRRLQLMQENDEKMKAQLRKVDDSAFKDMKMMKKDDDDDDLMAFANMGKGKKGGKGGGKKK